MNFFKRIYPTMKANSYRVTNKSPTLWLGFLVNPQNAQE
ncbi:hypothetical protein [Pseudomonas phage PseuP_222]|nr:hypothetical protein [Pseudomonas phage PseuP_222]